MRAGEIICPITILICSGLWGGVKDFVVESSDYVSCQRKRFKKTKIKCKRSNGEGGSVDAAKEATGGGSDAGLTVAQQRCFQRVLRPL